MKFLLIALTDESRRFQRGILPKGSRFLRWPNIEVAQLASLLSPWDELYYLDEQVEELKSDRATDTILLYTGYPEPAHLGEVASSLHRKGKQVICFGPLASLQPEAVERWSDVVVIGDIAAIWPELRADLEAGRLKTQYLALKEPQYHPPRPEIWMSQPRLFSKFQAIRAVLGCSCPEALKRFCPQAIYYGAKFYKRAITEVVGEVVSLPFKTIWLLDDDIGRFPEYYTRLFERLWGTHHEFVVQASAQIFKYPDLLAQLPKAGVRVVALNEGWLELKQLINEPDYLQSRGREVQMLHHSRILVGVRILEHPLEPLDLRRVYNRLYRLGIDFLAIRSLTLPGEKPFPSQLNRFSNKSIFWPQAMSGPQSPTGMLWLKDRFYALDSILLRSLKSLPQVGIYSMIFYFLRGNLAYRQNFLEGIPYPP